MLITLPWPSSKLNGHAKGYWRPKAESTKLYRRDVWALALEAKVKRCPTARLVFTYHPPNLAKRDCQNMPGMLKAAVDGIADAMGCDDHLFRCAWPETFAAPVKGGAVLVDVQCTVLENI